MHQLLCFWSIINDTRLVGINILTFVNSLLRRFLAANFTKFWNCRVKQTPTKWQPNNNQQPHQMVTKVKYSIDITNKQYMSLSWVTMRDLGTLMEVILLPGSRNSSFCVRQQHYIVFRFSSIPFQIIRITIMIMYFINSTLYIDCRIPLKT